LIISLGEVSLGRVGTRRDGRVSMASSSARAMHPAPSNGRLVMEDQVSMASSSARAMHRPSANACPDPTKSFNGLLIGPGDASSPRSRDRSRFYDRFNGLLIGPGDASPAMGAMCGRSVYVSMASSSARAMHLIGLKKPAPSATVGFNGLLIGPGDASCAGEMPGA